MNLISRLWFKNSRQFCRCRKPWLRASSQLRRTGQQWLCLPDLHVGDSCTFDHDCDAAPGVFYQAKTPALRSVITQTRVEFQSNPLDAAKHERDLIQRQG